SLCRSALLTASLLALTTAGCKREDAKPESAARAVWSWARQGDVTKFRELYPTDAELADLFDPAFAAKFQNNLRQAVAALPKKPPNVRVLDVKLVREADVPAGGMLRKPAHLAKVIVRI